MAGANWQQLYYLGSHGWGRSSSYFKMRMPPCSNDILDWKCLFPLPFLKFETTGTSWWHLLFTLSPHSSFKVCWQLCGKWSLTIHLKTLLGVCKVKIDHNSKAQSKRSSTVPSSDHRKPWQTLSHSEMPTTYPFLKTSKPDVTKRSIYSSKKSKPAGYAWAFSVLFKGRML